MHSQQKNVKSFLFAYRYQSFRRNFSGFYLDITKYHVKILP